MITEFDPSTYIVNESDFLRDCETETVCVKENGHAPNLVYAKL